MTARGVKVDAPRKPTAAEVAEWAERHDLRGSATDLRCAFEDAQTLHMADGVKATRTLPHPGSPEASAMLDSLLAEYNYPANTKNAARAGWEAAERWLRTAGVDSVDGGQPK
jgi:hypothetical protein